MNHQTPKRQKIRLWGAPNGGGIKRWRKAVLVPSGVAEALLLNLEQWRKEGKVSSFRFERQGWLGTGRAAFWIGRIPKAERPYCGAKTRQGTPCKARCVADKDRCRLHGGLSTGARTAEGRQRIIDSNRRRAEARRTHAEASRVPADYP